MKNESLPTRKVSLDGKGTAIAVVSQKGDDYICLTDIARYKDSERTDYIIRQLVAQPQYHRISRHLGTAE
jgi:hypothetical protein